MKQVFGDDHDPIGAQRKIEAEMVSANAAILSDLHRAEKKPPVATTPHILT
jgi:hypothetical protein